MTRIEASRLADWIDGHDRPRETELIRQGNRYGVRIYSLDQIDDAATIDGLFGAPDGYAVMPEHAWSVSEARAILGY